MERGHFVRDGTFSATARDALPLAPPPAAVVRTSDAEFEAGLGAREGGVLAVAAHGRRL